MQKCTHKVAFKVAGTISGPSVGIEILCTLHTKCSVCSYDLTDDQVKLALVRVYSPDVAEILFGLYYHRKSYFELLIRLNGLGVSSPLVEGK